MEILQESKKAYFNSIIDYSVSLLKKGAENDIKHIDFIISSFM